jgi:cell division septation protein DedD
MRVDRSDGKTARYGFGGAGLAIAIHLASAAPARDLTGPAELPPASYAGQQYVDSRGCMFVRAGTADQVVWIPRVSRGGEPACDNPPSGRRVPVEGETAAPADPAAKTEATKEAAGDEASSRPLQEVAAPGGVFVAVGSFAEAGNVSRAEARLAELGYPAVRGRLAGGSTLTTVYAGPFADAEAAAKAGKALRDRGFPDAVVIRP